MMTYQTHMIAMCRFRLSWTIRSYNDEATLLFAVLRAH